MQNTAIGLYFNLLANIQANKAGKTGIIKKLRSAKINSNPKDTNKNRLRENLFSFNPK